MRRVIVLALAVGISLAVTSCQGQTAPASLEPTRSQPTLDSTIGPMSASTNVPATNTAFPTPEVPNANEGTLPPGARARLGIGVIESDDISPDGRLMAVGTTSGMFVYDTDTFELVWSQYTHSPSTGIWSPDGQSLAIRFSYVEVSVRSANDGSELFHITHTTYISDFTWSPDGKRLAVGWGGGYAHGAISPRVTLWDIRDAQSTLLEVATDEALYYQSGVRDVEWAPDGKTIAASTTINIGRPGAEPLEQVEALIWNAETGKLLRTFLPQDLGIGRRLRLAYSPDGKRLAGHGEPELVGAFGDPHVMVWDVETGALIFERSDSEQDIAAFVWSPDGDYLAVGTGGDDFEGTITITIWDMRTGEPTKVLKGPHVSIRAIAWSPDGATIVSGGGHYSAEPVFVWDVQSGDQRIVVSATTELRDQVEYVEWLPDGGAFITMSNDRIERIDARTGKVGPLLINNSTLLRSNGLSWSPDGESIGVMISDYPTYVLWDVQSGKATHKFRERDASLEWLPRGEIDYKAGEKVVRQVGFPYFNVTGFSVSPDSRLAAVGFTANDPATNTQVWRVIVWDTTRDVLLRQLEFPQYVEAMSIAWSPDGSKLAVGGGRYFGHDTPYVYGWEQNVVTLWDIASGRKLDEYFGHTGRVISLAFSPDGQTLASGGTEGTVILWDIEL